MAPIALANNKLTHLSVKSFYTWLRTRGLELFCLAGVLIAPCVGLASASTISCANVSLARISGKNLKKSYLELMEKRQLLGQRDQGLVDENLVVENGGLCGITCATNVINASLRSIGRAPIPSAQVAQSLVMKVQALFASDARMGASFYRLASSASDFLIDHDLDLIVSETSLAARGEFNESAIVGAQNSLLLGALESPSGARHAIVILEVDLKTHRIRYSDPEFPRIVMGANYRMAIDAETNLPTLAFDIPANGEMVPWTLFDLIEFKLAL